MTDFAFTIGQPVRIIGRNRFVGMTGKLTSIGKEGGEIFDLGPGRRGVGVLLDGDDIDRPRYFSSREIEAV
jgi:hypothetical protein